jgi:hypothetical protein
MNTNVNAAAHVFAETLRRNEVVKGYDIEAKGDAVRVMLPLYHLLMEDMQIAINLAHKNGVKVMFERCEFSIDIIFYL